MTVEERDALAELTLAAQRLAQAVEAGDVSSAPVVADVRTLVERLEQRRFDVVVVGEFNRGKSTIVNRLVDAKVLPSGALPVTAVVTEVRHGDDEKATVVLSGGEEQVIDLDALEQYVTEESNPYNERRVESVRIAVPSALLADGVSIIDTPGIGSIFRHGGDKARTMARRADAAVLVLSADSPMTEAERNLISQLGARSTRTFVVLNRIDHLDSSEIDEVTGFVSKFLTEAFGQPQRLYPVSAKTGDGFDAFTTDLEEFMREGIDDARIGLARKDLAVTADRIENDCVLEQSALSLSANELQQRVARFHEASEGQGEGFGDDKVLLGHAIERMLAESSQRLGASIDQDAAIQRMHVAAERIAQQGGVSQTDAIERAIDAEVRSTIEPLHRKEVAAIDDSWARASDRFERATERRVDRLREIAGSLFEVDLRSLPDTRPASRQGGFHYSEISGTSGLGSGFFMTRKRLEAKGARRLREELDHHLDLLRKDTASRLEASRQEMLQAMTERMKEMEEAITTALSRAQTARDSVEESRTAFAERASHLRSVAQSARRQAHAN